MDLVYILEGFRQEGSSYIAQFSAELNTLKVAIFNNNNFKHVTTEIVRIGKSRGIIGAEVQAFDNLKNEADGLLIPFRTGEVKILNVLSDKITLNNSEFSHGPYSYERN